MGTSRGRRSRTYNPLAHPDSEQGAWTKARMRKRILATGSFLSTLLLVLSNSPAIAQSRIGLGNSSQRVSFTSAGSNAVDVALGSCSADPINGINYGGSCTLSSGTPGTFGGDSGNWSITTSTNGDAPIMIYDSVGGVMPVMSVNMDGATSTFTWTSTSDSDSLTGTITWQTASDNANQPHLAGTMTVTSVSGQADFTSLFPVGSTQHVDITLAPLSCPPSIPVGSCNRNDLFAASGYTLGSAVSSGEVLVTQTPEPSSALLFGLGLLSVGLVLRRRRFA